MERPGTASSRAAFHRAVIAGLSLALAFSLSPSSVDALLGGALRLLLLYSSWDAVNVIVITTAVALGLANIGWKARKSSSGTAAVGSKTPAEEEHDSAVAADDDNDDKKKEEEENIKEEGEAVSSFAKEEFYDVDTVLDVDPAVSLSSFLTVPALPLRHLSNPSVVQLSKSESLSDLRNVRSMNRSATNAFRNRNESDDEEEEEEEEEEKQQQQRRRQKQYADNSSYRGSGRFRRQRLPSYRMDEEDIIYGGRAVNGGAVMGSTGGGSSMYYYPPDSGRSTSRRLRRSSSLEWQHPPPPSQFELPRKPIARSGSVSTIYSDFRFFPFPQDELGFKRYLITPPPTLTTFDDADDEGEDGLATSSPVSNASPYLYSYPSPDGVAIWSPPSPEKAIPTRGREEEEEEEEKKKKKKRNGGSLPIKILPPFSTQVPLSRSPPDPPPKALPSRSPSPSTDSSVNRKAEAFINKFRAQMRSQHVESFERCKRRLERAA